MFSCSLHKKISKCRWTIDFFKPTTAFNRPENSSTGFLFIVSEANRFHLNSIDNNSKSMRCAWLEYILLTQISCFSSLWHMCLYVVWLKLRSKSHTGCKNRAKYFAKCHQFPWHMTKNGDTYETTCIQWYEHWTYILLELTFSCQTIVV